VLSSGRPEIIVDLSLRLGNQLFQYAAASQLELDGATVVFSKRTYQPSGGLAESTDRLERYTGVTLPVASTRQELATGYVPPTNITSPRVNIVLRAPIIFPTVHRIFRPTSFEPRPETLPTWPRYRIQAYFQHRSWFDRNLASVLKQIEGATHDTRIQYPAFDLCVNLRRGDYIGLGWDLSYDYYLRALELFSNDDVKSVVVTSDDRLTARVFSEILQSNGYDSCTANEVIVASQSDSGEPVDPVLRDFSLLANARNLVMSNSTFCWWAAALGDVLMAKTGNRIVAYPRGWVEFPDDASDGLVRPEWTVVPT
jgi:hypothetical protein